MKVREKIKDPQFLYRLEALGFKKTGESLINTTGTAEDFVYKVSDSHSIQCLIGRFGDRIEEATFSVIDHDYCDDEVSVPGIYSQADLDKLISLFR